MEGTAGGIHAAGTVAKPVSEGVTDTRGNSVGTEVNSLGLELVAGVLGNASGTGEKPESGAATGMAVNVVGAAAVTRVPHTPQKLTAPFRGDPHLPQKLAISISCRAHSEWPAVASRRTIP